MSARKLSLPARGLTVLALAAALAGCSVMPGGSFWGGSSKPVPADLGANVPVLGVRQAWTGKVGAVAGLSLTVQVSGSTVMLASAEWMA